MTVLPPISTEGMTSEDVDELVESTRNAMVKALEAISRPGPSHQTNIKVAPEDLQTPLAELPRQLGHSDDATPRRRKDESNDDTPMKGGSELRKVESRGAETTDDEMDDDAVLLKRPEGE
jgi:lysophosphatidate acyltransferase